VTYASYVPGFNVFFSFPVSSRVSSN